MILVSRVLVALAGLLFVVIGVGMWFNTGEAAGNFGLTELAPMGYATVRADIGGFFLVAGLLSIVGVLTLNSNLLWPVQLLMLAALLGRVVTLGFGGELNADSAMPMAVEVLVIAVLAWCRGLWPVSPR